MFLVMFFKRSPEILILIFIDTIKGIWIFLVMSWKNEIFLFDIPQFSFLKFLNVPFYIPQYSFLIFLWGGYS